MYSTYKTIITNPVGHELLDGALKRPALYPGSVPGVPGVPGVPLGPGDANIPQIQNSGTASFMNTNQ